MATVWMVSGNKGGVGKSLVSLALTQTLLNTCGPNIALIDGDGRTPDVYKLCQRRIPTRVLDFRRLRPDSAHSMTEDEYFNVIYSFLKVADHVIINTPDGADDQLMGWFDSTLQCTESLSTIDTVQFKFLFVLNTLEDGLEYLSRLSDRFQMFYPIRNLYFGSSDRFKCFNQQYADNYNRIVEFPKLGGSELEHLKRLRVLPQEYVDLRPDPKLLTSRVPHLLSRQRVLNWLCKVHEEFADMIDDDVSNLRQGIAHE